jgi:hypothetical protein
MTIICPIQGTESNIQAAFIDDIVGARAWGLGGAYRTLVNDAGSMLWNPAGLVDLQHNYSISLEHLELMDFFSYSYLGYARRIDERLAWGSGLFYSGDDIMSEFIGYASLAFDGAIMVDLVLREIIPEGLIGIGLSGKFFYASFGNNTTATNPPFIEDHQVSGNATGFSIDLGFKVKPTTRDHFSLTFKNLLNRIRWKSDNIANTAYGSYHEDLPITSTIGYARHQSSFILAVDVEKGLYYDVEDNLYLGLEYLLSRELTLRTGYAQELVTADSKRWSLGAGINIDIPSLPLIRFDMTYLMHLEWERYNSLLFAITLP